MALRATREPAAGRPQLRTRCQGDAALHRGAVPHRRHVRLLLPERRAAECVRRVRRVPEETAAVLAEFADSGFVNLVGGCCGTTPRTSRRSPGSSRAASPGSPSSLPRPCGSPASSR
ncbi:homocysteine S-methyltransferase family protein [Blastococcus brunescens]|uniref:Homocysteine S-methyltransferase family protein n=1 Tax=Blastococcus brunescens TaxID=1564165 RepID=A0ABZ1BAJ3_9ACTN|nr:homocysteine S-methyltransferase family protein [Blastococcus sp. BMG 8361]WRL66993.1 homocysteine S-methyltransferase family protein [Blastococcus sp. BMG 8361]